MQNWYPGDAEGRGGIYNFVTKRGKAMRKAKISWTQVETGSAITWKYPSCILQGDDSVGEFYSVALTNHRQQADTGTKMIHIGKNTRSTIVSKGISAGRGQNTYRGLVKMLEGRDGRAQPLAVRLAAHRRPAAAPTRSRTSRCATRRAKVEHEATTSKISEDQLFYCRQRGISEEDAVSMIVNGFAKQVLKELPMEFAVEAQKLLGHVARRERRLDRRRERDGRRCCSVEGAARADRAERRDPEGAGPRAPRRARCTRSWGRTARASRTLAGVLAGRADYEVTGGTATLDGEDLLALAPEERAATGVFLGFQYPVEIPGVGEPLLPPDRAQRAPAGPRRGGARRDRLPRSSPRRR